MRHHAAIRPETLASLRTGITDGGPVSLDWVFFGLSERQPSDVRVGRESYSVAHTAFLRMIPPTRLRHVYALVPSALLLLALVGSGSSATSRSPVCFSPSAGRCPFPCLDSPLPGFLDGLGAPVVEGARGGRFLLRGGRLVGVTWTHEGHDGEGKEKGGLAETRQRFANMVLFLLAPSSEYAPVRLMRVRYCRLLCDTAADVSANPFRGPREDQASYHNGS